MPLENSSELEIQPNQTKKNSSFRQYADALPKYE
jgi:hypothetical protein